MQGAEGLLEAQQVQEHGAGQERRRGARGNLRAVVLHQVEQGDASLLLHPDELVERLRRVQGAGSRRQREAARAFAQDLYQVAPARSGPHEASRGPHQVLEGGLQSRPGAMRAVEVDEQREVGDEVHRGRAAASGGRPMDAPDVVAGTEVAHAQIGEALARPREGELLGREARTRPQLLEAGDRPHAREDREGRDVGNRALRVEEAEGIRGGQRQRADRVDAPRARARGAIHQPAPACAPERTGLEQGALYDLDRPGLLHYQRAPAHGEKLCQRVVGDGIQARGMVFQSKNH